MLNRKHLHYVFYNLLNVYEKYTIQIQQNNRKLCLLIDKSLSTSNKFTLVSKLIKRISLLFDSIEIICYTTRHWMGGNSFKSWEATRPPYPGRVNDLLYIRYNYNK